MLSVLTLNLWHDNGPYAERRRLLRGWIDRLNPDLIGFQEALRGDKVDQVAELLNGAGYYLDYVRASAFWVGEGVDFGNAVASRWPILDRAELRLPDAGDGETRAALSVMVDAPVGPVALCVTHLNWKAHHGWARERQVVAVCDFARRRRPPDGFPPILVGDFNAEPESAEIRYVTGMQSLDGRSVHFYDAWRLAGGGGDGATWSNHNAYARLGLEPDRRIDYIFTGAPKRNGIGLVERCRVVCNQEVGGIWPTDHFGLYAELRTEPLPGLAAT
jgi:endonuclease/exonuclease/phosphatase family metal-dependent hydrolase